MQTVQVNDFRNSSFDGNSKGVDCKSANIDKQYNLYANKISNPLEAKGKNENIVFDVYINLFGDFKIFIFAIIVSIIFLVSIIFGSDFSSIKQYVSAIVSLSIVASFLIFTVFFIIQHLAKYKRKLIFMSESIYFDYKTNNKEIKYEELRDSKTIPNLLGYSIYIYKKYEPYAYLKFDIYSLDDANSIEKLIDNKKVRIPSKTVPYNVP